jgi:transcriptional regulator with XRE-family HTH domain
MALLNQLIGRRMRILRLERGLSQVELGALIGASADDIDRLEKGVKRLRAALLTRMAQALDVDVSAFFRAEANADDAADWEDDRRQPDGSRHSLH